MMLWRMLGITLSRVIQAKAKRLATQVIRSTEMGMSGWIYDLAAERCMAFR